MPGKRALASGVYRAPRSTGPNPGLPGRPASVETEKSLMTKAWGRATGGRAEGPPRPVGRPFIGAQDWVVQTDCRVFDMPPGIDPSFELFAAKSLRAHGN